MHDNGLATEAENKTSQYGKKININTKVFKKVRMWCGSADQLTVSRRKYLNIRY